MRDRLIRLAAACGGDYAKLRQALYRQQEVKEDGPVADAVTILDDDYPAALRQLHQPPLVLFYQGNRHLLSQPKAAVVGSRLADAYGLDMTVKVVSQLRGRYVIVSGMARGIDAIAHRTAAASIGVLGCGLDICYPAENAALYGFMRRHQLLITEYPCGVRPLRQHFPFRNRIIAALGEVLIVTQAQARSGTMHTVNAALGLGRDVWAVPYRSGEPDGQGCNELIRDGANILQWDAEKRSFRDFL